MSFHLAKVQQEDCTAFAIVDEAASVNWPLARAMEQGKASRREMFEHWFGSIFGKDPSLHWVKVVDSETGEMAAAALWRFPAVESNDPKEEADAVDENTKWHKGEVGEIPPVFEEMGKRWKAFQDEFIGDQPFASEISSSLPLSL